LHAQTALEEEVKRLKQMEAELQRLRQAEQAEKTQLLGQVEQLRWARVSDWRAVTSADGTLVGNGLHGRASCFARQSARLTLWRASCRPRRSWVRLAAFEPLLYLSICNRSVALPIPHLSRTEEEVKVLREVAMQFEVQKKEVATLQEQLRRAAAEKAQMSDVFIRFYSIGLSVPMSGAVAAFLLVHSAAARADQHSYAQEMRRLQDVEVQLKTLQAGSLRASSAGKVFLSLCIFVYLYF
jgi:hypothetical protein